MVLLVYHIKVNVLVIIMGETGFGKTSLIKILFQILNNGEELGDIVNINPSIICLLFLFSLLADEFIKVDWLLFIDSWLLSEMIFSLGYR